MWPVFLALLSAVETLLSLVSLTAASNHESVLKNMYWTKVHDDSGTAYWGLFAVYFAPSHTYFYNQGGVYKYANDDCLADVCNDCGSSGQVVVAFTAVTLLCAVTSTAFYILRNLSTFKTKTFKILTIATTGAALVSSGITVLTWGSSCQNSIKNEYSDSRVGMGPSFGLAIGVAVLCLIALPLDIFLTPLEAPGTITEPLNPSAPYEIEDEAIKSDSVSPLSGSTQNFVPAQIVQRTCFCSFCGGQNTVTGGGHCTECKRKLAREYPSHPAEITRFCSACGKKHVVEHGLKFCCNCGVELQF